MKSTSKKSKTSVEFTVSFDQDDFEPARIKALERLARDIKVPGFRSGRAPASKVESHVNPNELASLTLDLMVRRSIPQLFDKAGVLPLSTPHVDVLKFVPGESAEIKVTADIMPEVVLGDYKKLAAPYKKPVIKDSDVKDVVDRIADNFAESKVVKRAAKQGDDVTFDFKGMKDGEAFEGGSATDYTLRLGSGQFIPGFEEGLIGHASGDKFDLPLTFPKEYGAKHLAGQKVIFEILVKQVNEISRPAIDDKLAEKTGAFKTIAELREDVRKNLTAQAEREAENHYKDELLRELVEKSKTTAPITLTEEQFNHIKEDQMRNLEARGMTVEQYLKANKQKMSDWEKEMRAAAEQRVIGSLVMNQLINDLKINVNDAAVEQRLAELRHAYGKNEDAIKQLDRPEVKNNIRHQMRIDAALDKLVELNQSHAKAPKQTAKKGKK